MKIEKWKTDNGEIDIPILEDEEIETNEDLQNFEDTVDLTNILNVDGDRNE